MLIVGVTEGFTGSWPVTLVLSLGLLLVGCLLIYIARGMVRLEPRAWTANRVLAAIIVVIGILSVLSGDLWSIVYVAFNALILVFLGTDQVRSAFERSAGSVHVQPS